EIVIVANPLVAELFSPHPDCDRVIIYDKKGQHQGIRGRWQLCQKLRREHFDLAILFQNAMEAAIITWVAGIPRRAGYTTDSRRLLLNHQIPIGDTERRLHHTDYYLNLLSSLGIAAAKTPLRLFNTGDELLWAQKKLAQNNNWTTINPGASYGSAKRWIPERFASVADHLNKKYQQNIVLIGGPGEQDIGRDIEKMMSHQPLNLIGKTSVREMMAILASCALLITNDSGPMHVAAALNTPLVAIFGPTDHTTTSPMTSKASLIHKDTPCAPCLLRQCPKEHQCMLAVTAEEVFQAAASLLDSHQ
ncbi:MAG: lipopolysaccharide heptosyltransferase II, partial [Xanthomonadaceae bacterium]|nr:lipopolysaccharide heptosyltransferase II [Xanthomonadaceae bacterium]